MSETLNDSHRKAVGRGKNKNIEMARIRKLSPLVGESVNRQVDERGKCEQKRKRVSYRTTLNICLSFLNGRKMRSGISVIKKYGKE